jgi:hypothetical protein
LDPFENALAEHLLQELMFQHLTGKEVKQIYQVSPLWDEIASDSKKCGEKLKLRINKKGDRIHDKLQIISKNKRKYGMLWLDMYSLVALQNTTLIQEIVAGLGSSLKALRIGGFMMTSDVVVLIRSLPNLERLNLETFLNDEPADLSPLLLPKLRKLDLRHPDKLWLGLFSKVSILEDFSIKGIKDTDLLLLENFVLRQEKLKNLYIDSSFETSPGRQYKIFSDLSRVKFRLESIVLLGISIDKDSAAKFFQQQVNLKKVRIEKFIE